MDFESKYIEIRQFLSVSELEFNLDKKIDELFDSDNLKMEILSKITQFINYFSIFKNVKPFMNSVYYCIETTLDIGVESVGDFKELLVKNALMRFVQEYIDYAQLTQKRQVLRLLSDSFEKLQIQPIIINLGLLLRPMYQDKAYLDRANNTKDVKISYSLLDDIEIKIKTIIDEWMKAQVITLSNQDKIKTELRNKYEDLASNFKITKDSDIYLKLFTEVMEMLSMRLTMISLMGTISDDSLAPIPIK
ncbi:MAG: hypothetical protein KAW66_12855 [Candidatus Lokiarchaeota archaeon]|jgi:hypothetical protein|nr:hypothetical protein [Candidatus Lokiarchaeota archaeon]